MVLNLVLIDTFHTHLHECLTAQQVDAGTVLFEIGDEIDSVYLVQQGEAVLERSTVDGQHLVLQRAGAGDLIAEASLFKSHYHCLCRAIKPLFLHVYSKKRVIQVMESDSSFCFDVMEALSEQVVLQRSRLELWRIKGAEQRIWQFLMLRSNGEGKITIPTPYMQLATELDLTHETLYRVLASLERQGRIRRNGNMIEIITA